MKKFTQGLLMVLWMWGSLATLCPAATQSLSDQELDRLQVGTLSEDGLSVFLEDFLTLGMDLLSKEVGTTEKIGDIRASHSVLADQTNLSFVMAEQNQPVEVSNENDATLINGNPEHLPGTDEISDIFSQGSFINSAVASQSNIAFVFTEAPAHITQTNVATVINQ